MISDNTKKPAAAATATDEKLNASKYSSYLNDSTEKQFCQVMLAGICELADDILNAGCLDNETAGYAGEIKGRAYALKFVLGV